MRGRMLEMTLGLGPLITFCIRTMSSNVRASGPYVSYWMFDVGTRPNGGLKP